MMPLLVVLLSQGSAQLLFFKPGDVTKTVCNQSVLLPCYVTNLKEHNMAAMFVQWKFNDQLFYSFQGNGSLSKARPDFSSAELNLQEVPRGDLSLTIRNMGQALEGMYTCDVTEASRTGLSMVSLRHRQLFMFNLRVYVPLALGLSLAVVFFWLHFAVSAVIFPPHRKPSGKTLSILAFLGIFPTIFVMVGLELLFTYEYSLPSRAGLGIAVIPATFMILLLQYYLHPLSGRYNVIVLLLTALKGVEFVILVIGCGLCFAACPPAKVALLIAGVVMFSAFVCADLLCSLAQSRKDAFQGEKSAHGKGDEKH